VSRGSKFLSALPIGARDVIERHLTEVRLRRGQTVAQAYSVLETAYFPKDSVFSVDLPLSNGASFSTGFIGSDGLLGAGMSLDDRVCLYNVSVMVGGFAYVMPMSRLKELLLKMPELRKRALAYDQYFLAQVQQSAACIALHDLPGRLSSWLLRVKALAGSKISMTQSEIALMLGVRRTSVTACMVELQHAGAIESRRGEIQIVDSKKIRAMACGCQVDISSHYRRLFEVGFDER
jgi:CRP-like cAMP-binding protein